MRYFRQYGRQQVAHDTIDLCRGSATAGWSRLSFLRYQRMKRWSKEVGKVPIRVADPDTHGSVSFWEAGSGSAIDWKAGYGSELKRLKLDSWTLTVKAQNGTLEGLQTSGRRLMWSRLRVLIRITYCK